MILFSFMFALLKLFLTIALGVFVPLLITIAVCYGLIMLSSGSTSFLVCTVRDMMGKGKRKKH